MVNRQGVLETFVGEWLSTSGPPYSGERIEALDRIVARHRWDTALMEADFTKQIESEPESLVGSQLFISSCKS